MTTELSNKRIGKLVDLHRDSVGDWYRRYQQGGLGALYQFGYGTNVSELESNAGSILKSFTEQPPMTTAEAKARIEGLTGISRSPTQVRAFMKRQGLRYLQTGHIPCKADNEKQQTWVKEILDPAIAQAQEGSCHLYQS